MRWWRMCRESASNLQGETMDNGISQSEAVAKIRDLIRDVKVAMLTTNGPHGELSKTIATQGKSHPAEHKKIALRRFCC